MTVVLTLARPFCIVMASDAAVREDYEDGAVSYTTGAKSFALPSIGAVTTWGARDGNGIAQLINRLKGSAEIATVQELAQAVHVYLCTEYDPKSRGLSHVGYHVAGLTDGVPYVYHSFWQPPGEGRVEGSYEFQAHTPIPAKGIFALYNGRHDLAHKVIESIFDEVRRGQAPRTTLSTGTGLVAHAHLALRFAAEISRDVGPPFLARVIAPDNSLHSHELPALLPFGDAESDSLRHFANTIEELRFEE